MSNTWKTLIENDLVSKRQENILSDEESERMQDEEDNARRTRERKIEAIIKSVFRRLGIEISEMYYIEESNREASVTLDDSEIDLGKISEILKSGLASNYTISIMKEYNLSINFHVLPEIDNVVMKK